MARNVLDLLSLLKFKAQFHRTLAAISVPTTYKKINCFGGHEAIFVEVQFVLAVLDSHATLQEGNNLSIFIVVIGCS